MALAKGHKSYVLIAPETTYGTAATTGFHKVEVVSVSCDPAIGMIPDSSLYNARARRGLYQGGLLYRGTLRIRANYEGAALLHLLRSAHLGGASGASTGYLYALAVSGASNHTFTDGNTLRSLTMQMQEGDVAGDGTVQEVRGLVITGYTFRISPGTGADAMGMYEFTYVAATKTEGVTENASPAAFPTANPVLFHQCVAQVDGSGSTGNIRSLEISYTVPMVEDRFTLGSINPLQPVPNDFVTATIKVTREFDTIALFNKARNFSAPAAALNFKFQGGVIVTSHNYEQEFTVTNARIQDYSNPVEDYGIIVANATWLAYDNGGESLKVRIKNAATSLT